MARFPPALSPTIHKGFIAIYLTLLTASNYKLITAIKGSDFGDFDKVAQNWFIFFNDRFVKTVQIPISLK